MPQQNPAGDSASTPAAAATPRPGHKKPSPNQPMVNGMTREQLEQVFLAELPMIRRLLASIARRQRLSASEAEDFASEVHLRIISNDYAILRKFRGHSSLR